MTPMSSAGARLSRPLPLASKLALWIHYGTTVFFEIVRTGWVSRF